MSQKFDKVALRNMVKKGRYGEVLEILSECAPTQDLQNQVELQQATHHDAEKDYRNGVLSHEKYELQRAKIRSALLYFIDEIDAELSQAKVFVAAPVDTSSETQSGEEIVSPSVQTSKEVSNHLPSPSAESSKTGKTTPFYTIIYMLIAVVFTLVAVFGYSEFVKSDEDDPNRDKDNKSAIEVVPPTNPQKESKATDPKPPKPSSKVVETPVEKPETPYQELGESVIIENKDKSSDSVDQQFSEFPNSTRNRVVSNNFEIIPTYKCPNPQNCKSIKIEYDVDYEFVMYIIEDDIEKKIKKIGDKESVKIEKDTFDIILVDSKRKGRYICSQCIINDLTTRISFTHEKRYQNRIKAK